MIFYYRDNGKVIMKSLEKMDTHFEVLDYEPTPNEKLLIEQNYEMEVQDGKLVLKEPEYIKDKKKKDKMNELGAKIEGANTISKLKDILKDLIWQ